MNCKKELLINQNLIMEKLADIEKAMVLIQRMASIEKEDFLDDQILLSGAKYQLILLIEAAQSICNHLAARMAKEVPVSYADCFRILEKNKVISKELALKLVSMAKFRNLLVHQYGRVDDSIVYSILKNDTIDLVKYTEEIKSFLSSVGEEEIRGQGKVPSDRCGEKGD